MLSQPNTIAHCSTKYRCTKCFLSKKLSKMFSELVGRKTGAVHFKTIPLCYTFITTSEMCIPSDWKCLWNCSLCGFRFGTLGFRKDSSRLDGNDRNLSRYRFRVSFEELNQIVKEKLI